MNLHLMLLVVAALIISSDGTSVAVDQAKLLKIPSPNLVQPNDAVLNSKDNRFLRVHDGSTADEERTVNLINMLDRNWFGMGKNSANLAVRKSSIVKGVVRNQYGTITMIGKANPVSDFSMITLGMMLKDVQFKQKMFKIWDKVPLPEIMHKLGASNLKDKKVAEMVTEYVQRLKRHTL